MTDAELLEATLTLVGDGLGYYVESRGWESARQMWEHVTSCGLCDPFGEDPFIEDNPARPVHGPPRPLGAIDRMMMDAYRGLAEAMLRPMRVLGRSE